MKTGILVLLVLISAQSFADSRIKVINNSGRTVQAIWQAGFCTGNVQDWEGDEQFTVCDDKELKRGEEFSVLFNMFYFDRSVKVFDKQQGRIAYCNSMDNVTITIEEDIHGVQTADSNC